MSKCVCEFISRLKTRLKDEPNHPYPRPPRVARDVTLAWSWNCPLVSLSFSRSRRKSSDPKMSCDVILQLICVIVLAFSLIQNNPPRASLRPSSLPPSPSLKPDPLRASHVSLGISLIHARSLKVYHDPAHPRNRKLGRTSTRCQDTHALPLHVLSIYS